MLLKVSEDLLQRQKRKQKQKQTKATRFLVFRKHEQLQRSLQTPSWKNKRKYKSISKNFTRLVHRKKSLKYKTREGEKRDRSARSERERGAVPKAEVQCLYHNRKFCFSRLIKELFKSIVVLKGLKNITARGRKKFEISRYRFLANQWSHFFVCSV